MNRESHTTQSSIVNRQSSIAKVHFIGICGTGMAPLAAMLKDRGHEVSGSDEGVYPPMSDFLAQRSIQIFQRYDIANLKPEPDLVVVGNAQSRGNPEVEYVLNFGLNYTSFPEALKNFFLRDKRSVVVTGTHGKTTTTSMIAWGLHFAGQRPNYLIGGIAENFQSSYGLEGGEVFIVEGDEYDSAFFDKGPKFLHYLPYYAVIGNIEYDHADIYASLDAVRLQFSRFVNLIPGRGYLVVGADNSLALEVGRKAYSEIETFGFAPEADWGVRAVEPHERGVAFDVLYQKKLFRRLRLRLIGDFNIRNALAATAVLYHLGVAEDEIRDAMDAFEGVRRRLQLRAEVAGIRVYEDFAHHPTAVRETLRAVRQAYRPRRLWAVYEPRSATSRRNIFQLEIAEALSHADLVALPALFKPEKVPEAERLDLERLIDELRGAGRAAWNLGSVEGIIQKICQEAQPGDSVVILSNGGFGGIHDKLPQALAEAGKQA